MQNTKIKMLKQNYNDKIFCFRLFTYFYQNTSPPCLIDIIKASVPEANTEPEMLAIKFISL
jgi:hypothetical protein